jgi:hypothetical protein
LEKIMKMEIHTEMKDMMNKLTNNK